MQISLSFFAKRTPVLTAKKGFFAKLRHACSTAGNYCVEVTSLIQQRLPLHCDHRFSAAKSLKKVSTTIDIFLYTLQQLIIPLVFYTKKCLTTFNSSIVNTNPIAKILNMCSKFQIFAPPNCLAVDAPFSFL